MFHRWNSFRLARRAVARSRELQLTLLAAGVAFYAFLSLVPLTLLALGVATSLGGEALAEYVVDATGDVLTPSAQELLFEELIDDAGRQGATVVGALGLIWASSRVFRGLDRAFSQVYGTSAEKSFVDTVWDATVVAVAITAGLVLVAGLEAAISLAPVPGVSIVAPAFVLPAMLVALFPLYYVFPGVEMRAREALPGTVFAAVGWLVLGRTFAIYAGVVGASSIYGGLGAVFLVLVWLYVGSIVVVFGAVVNAVLADVG